MPLDPSSLVLPVVEWVREKILGYLKPIRVEYNETILKIELLPWTQMPALLGTFLVVVALVSIYTGSWTVFFVVIFFGGGATVLASWALRKIKTIIVANKPQEWIRVAKHGMFDAKPKPGVRNFKHFSVKNLKAITSEPVASTVMYDDTYGRPPSYKQMFNVCVMTGEGSTNILEKQSEDDAAEIVGYLNAFFFGEDEVESEAIAEEK